AHISEYSHSSAREYDPVRLRKLLMHRHEINRLQGKVEEKGLTIVPLKLYITTRGLAKVLIGLARGKDAPDKKRSTMDREKKREAERAMKGKFD
ncbi:MAG: SsrA-binding protein, partial [Bdellovibrionales bacterium]|nr:SsrA-binding protein [Bdellovibrionales bacterium]